MNSIVFSYVLLVIAFCLLGYYGIGFVLKIWNKSQKQKADKTSSQFEEMFIFLKKEVVVTLYIVTP